MPQFFVATLVALLTASAYAEVVKKRPLVVVLGGYNTCAKKGAPMPYVDKMLFGDHVACYVEHAWPTPVTESPSTVYSCFSGELTPSKAELRFGSAGEVPKSIKTGDPAAVVKAFTAYLKKQAGDREILFIGHSHGAWLGMQTALAFPPAQASFVSLDAISRVGCPPNTLYDLQRIARGKGHFPIDCGGFPSDFDRDAIQKLFRADRKVAFNIFAGGAGGGSPRIPPFSSIVVAGPGAPVNYRVDVPVTDVSDTRDNRMSLLAHDPTRFLAHHALTRDRRTWAKVREQIEAGYGVSLRGCERYDGKSKSIVSQTPKMILSVPRAALSGAHSMFFGKRH